MFAIILTLSLPQVFSPQTTMASGAGEGCDPYRPGYGNGLHTQVGNATQLDLTGTVGGAYSKITEYSPYTLHTGSGTQSWVLIDGQGQLAQVGWSEVLGGYRYTIAMSSPDNVHFPYNFWPGEPLTPIPQSFYYTALYNNLSGYPNDIDFQVAGSTLLDPNTGLPWLAQDQNGNPLHFKPQQAQTFSEIHQSSDQMPGDANNREDFYGNEVYWNGGWEAFSAEGATSPVVTTQDPGVAFAFAGAGTADNYLVWDRYCPVSLGPAASISPSFAQQNVFWQGPDANLWQAWYTGTWNGPTNWGFGPLASQPTDAFTTDGSTQIVFWRGTDGALWEAWYTGRWNGPSKVNAGPIAASPSVIAIPGQQDVFWQDTNNNLYEMWYSNGYWYGPAPIATTGNVASAPGAAAGPNGTQYVFWKGSNGDLWETWYGGTWSTPQDLGFSSMASAPSAFLNPNNGNQYVYWQGTDLNAHQAIYNGSWNSSTLSNLGSLGSSPTAVWNNGQGLLFWKGTDGNIWESTTSGSWTWGGPFKPNNGMGPLGLPATV